MELLTPDFGLMLWQVFSLTSLILFVIASIGLISNKHLLDAASKMQWVMLILFVPTIGPILYLTIGRKQNKPGKQ